MVSSQLHVPAALFPLATLDRRLDGTRAYLDAAAKRKIPSLSLPGIEPWSSSPRPS